MTEAALGDGPGFGGGGVSVFRGEAGDELHPLGPLQRALPFQQVQ